MGDGGKTHKFNKSDANNFVLVKTSGHVDSFEEYSPEKNPIEFTLNNSLKRKHEDNIDGTEERNKKSNGDTSFCVSPWEFRRLKADLMESQAQRIKLEDRIDQLHKKNKEAVIFFDKEKSEMKNQLDSFRNTIKGLEFRLNKVRKREIECKEELNEKKKDLELLKLKVGERVQLLESENEAFKQKISQLESEHNEGLFSLNKNIRNLEEEIKKLKLQLEEKEDLCSNLNLQLLSAVEKGKKYEEVQSQLFLAQLKIKELQNEAEEFIEAKNITIALSEKTIRMSQLEKELNEARCQLAEFKQFCHNNVVLEEIVHDLKVKLNAAEGNKKDTPNLQVRIIELESELQNWMEIAADFSSDSNRTRDSLRSYIETLQRKELTSTLEISNLNGVITSLEKKLALAHCELETGKVQNEKLQKMLQKLKVEVQLLRKKSNLVSRERDSYRQQLDLYERDLTLTGFSTESVTAETQVQMKNRLHNLESSLEDYRKHLDDLEAQLKIYQEEEPFDKVEKICNLKAEIKKLEECNSKLTKLNDELEKKLEARASKGEFLSPDTKILHFRKNPAYEAEKKEEEDLDYLKKECDRLRARVKLLESGEVMDITQKVSEDLKYCSSAKIAELEKELQSANLKMQRLKEVFKKTSQEFRDVSYMLLGYRIDLASNNKLYKLYNMYSTSPTDFLMFQQTKKGTLEMLGTAFAETLPKLVDEYLHRGNSIPAFLSAVTLQLYGLTAQSDEDEDDDEDNSNSNNNEIDDDGDEDDNGDHHCKYDDDSDDDRRDANYKNDCGSAGSEKSSDVEAEKKYYGVSSMEAVQLD